MEEFTSPLKKWPGGFSLPAYDDFTGEMWNAWKAAVEKSPDDTINRLYCYAGLKLIDAYGKWAFETPLKEVQSWEKAPGDEKMRFVSWLGRTMQEYINELINPKG